MAQQGKQIRLFTATAILFFLLIGFPIISWYYLRSGFEYRKGVMADLHDYGQLPNFSLITYNGQTLQTSDFANKIQVVAFVNLSKQENAGHVGSWLNQLHAQFDERKDVLFLIHILNSEATAQEVSAFAKQYQLEDTAQCYFLKDTAGSFERMAAQTYKIPANAIIDYFALTDLTGKIRRQYDARKPDDIKRLIEHIALLMPKENKRTAARREREE